jgi:hypothetical protein
LAIEAVSTPPKILRLSEDLPVGARRRPINGPRNPTNSTQKLIDKPAGIKLSVDRP